MSWIWSLIRAASRWVIKAAKWVYGISKRIIYIINKIDEIFPIIDKGKEHAKNYIEVLNSKEKKNLKLEKSVRFQQRKNLINKEIVDLVIFSKQARRFVRNLEIHVSHLNTHFEALKNIIGLAEISFEQAKYIKNLALKVNNLINKFRSFSDEDVESLVIQDVNSQYNKISIQEHYKSFEETRRLIHEECNDFMEEVRLNIKNTEKIILAISNTGGKRHPINKWANSGLLPMLNSLEKDLKVLLHSVDKIPKLENVPKK